MEAGLPMAKPLEFQGDRPHVLRVVDMKTGMALIEAVAQDPAL